MANYSFDAAWSDERRRLASIEATWDPTTTRHISSLGIGPTWHCLEVGGGAGSITRWLCSVAGSVTATDLDTRFLDEIDADNLEVRRHDITGDALEEDAYDLVHSRLLLEHLAGRDDALKRMVAALKPGGVLLIEDYDWATGRTAMRAEPAHEKAIGTILGLMTANGYDEEYGRKLPEELQAHGLVNVTGEGTVLVLDADSPSRDFYKLSLEQLRQPLVSAELLTDAEIEESMRLMDDPTFRTLSPIMMSASGRKP